MRMAIHVEDRACSEVWRLERTWPVRKLEVCNIAESSLTRRVRLPPNRVLRLTFK